MASIPVTRAVMLLPFISILDGIGAPTETLMAKHSLPIDLEGSENYYLPALNAIRFIEMSGRDQGIKDFGFLASKNANFNQLSARMRRIIVDSPTLFSAIKNLCVYAEIESSHVRHFICRQGDSIRLGGKFFGAKNLLHREHFQWTKIAFPIQVVRKFIGPNWAPETIAFESRYVPGSEVQQFWPNTRFISGQPYTWIDIPCRHLANSLIDASQEYYLDDCDNPVFGNLAKSLKLILPSYLGSKVPSIIDAAEMANMSLRSFQRALGDMGVTYRDIVNNVRFEKASMLLKKSDIRISDIAKMLGYTDVAHFSRAFRSIAGISPLQFRRINNGVFPIFDDQSSRIT